VLACGLVQLKTKTANAVTEFSAVVFTTPILFDLPQAHACGYTLLPHSRLFKLSFAKSKMLKSSLFSLVKPNLN
jgi:hypothetical protein